MPWLWLMSDQARLRDPAAVVPRLPRGSAVILRHGDSAARRLLAPGLKRVCDARRVGLVIAGDWRLAAALRCAGVHLPEASLARGCWAGLRLWRRARRAVLTASAHSESGIRVARRAGVDLVLLSPVLPTPSHPERTALGRMGLARRVRAAGVPIVALGGINARTITQLNGSGVVGVAGVGFAAEK
jgi:thiamine-phosphate pyrophosphorylase